jgi:hypothetical protein
VLAYDNGSTQSWKGMPTTNVLNTNGISTGSTTVNVSDLPNLKEISSLVGGQGNITHPVHQMANSNWVVLHSMSGSVSVPANDYFIFSSYIYTGNPTNRFNYNGNFGSTLGTNAGFGGAVNIQTNKWYRAVGYKQNTTGSAITVQNPRLETYSTSVWGGGDIDAWACCPQVEVRSGSSFSSPFTSTSRSTTTSLLDWAGNNTITMLSLTDYNSDNTFSFDGTNNTDRGIYLPSQDLNGSYSVEAWFKFDTGGTTQGIVGDTQYGWYRFLISTNNQVFAGHINSTSGYNYNFITAPTQLSTGTYHHAVHVFDASGGQRIYINGALDASNSNTLNFHLTGRGPQWVGQDRPSAQSTRNVLDGTVPVLRIYKNKALSAAEVAQNYNALRGRFGV